MQLWPVDQSGYVHLAQQCCMVAYTWKHYLLDLWQKLNKPFACCLIFLVLLLSILGTFAFNVV